MQINESTGIEPKIPLAAFKFLPLIVQIFKCFKPIETNSLFVLKAKSVTLALSTGLVARSLPLAQS